MNAINPKVLKQKEMVCIIYTLIKNCCFIITFFKWFVNGKGVVVLLLFWRFVRSLLKSFRKTVDFFKKKRYNDNVIEKGYEKVGLS